MSAAWAASPCASLACARSLCAALGLGLVQLGLGSGLGLGFGSGRRSLCAARVFPICPSRLSSGKPSLRKEACRLGRTWLGLGLGLELGLGLGFGLG